MAEGIRKRHSRACRAHSGRHCNCHPSWEAWVWHPRERKKERQSFPTEAAAKSWRRQATIEIEQGRRRAPTKLTLREAAQAWLDDARSGVVLTKSSTRYKPSVLRSYETSLGRHVLDDLGGAKLSEIRDVDLEGLVARLRTEGLSASSVRNAIMPLRAIYRRHHREVPVNPTRGLDLPAVEGRRDRIADPTEAAVLIAAAPAEHHALWAMAFYTGLRLGELRALRWSEVDLAKGVVRVEWSWDPKAGRIEPKSKAARRTVPIPSVLRDILVEHRVKAGDEPGFVFGKTPETPFSPATVDQRTKRAWKAFGLRPITLHEARHTFASLMIAAGVNAKALSTYMGHSSVTITYDRYGHLMPGSEREAAELLDAYLSAAEKAAEEAARQADLAAGLRAA